MFICAEKLKKSYFSGTVETPVLRGLDFSMESGSIGVILGPSGSGKTTLMNLIGGVDRADSGKLTVGGQDLTQMGDEQLTEYRRSDLGFVFQFYNLVPNLTAGENIEVMSNISRNPLPLAQVLEAVGLQDKAQRFPRELSGGEQQRVSIARAIVKNPKLLLCDEPTGALDYDTAKGVLSLIQRVNKQFGTTILMITHNSAIAGMAHVVFRLRRGEVTDFTRNAELVPAERIEW